MIRNATINDAQAVSDIYNYFVLNTTVTFEEVAISAEEMARRIHEVQIRHRWLVYEEGGKVAGFTYAGMWKPRSAYRHTVEASIYIEAAYRGKGIGRQLYSALVSELESLDILAKRY